MQCREIKQLIPEYIQGGLDGNIRNQVESHLSTCRDCREEIRLMEKTWQMLGEVESIEPAPGYIARFWTGVENRKPWYQMILQKTKEIVFQRPWVPALATAGVILMIAGITFLDLGRHPESETNLIAAFEDVDPDMVEHIDIIENLDLIQDIDFFTDLEIIENLDDLEAS